MITRQNNNLSNFDFSSGEAILIDKRVGLTSFSIVYKLRKILGIKKIGHAGTLDPFASGLLIICTGKKTKDISKYQETTKVYTGIISLGKRTPSMDLETEFIEEKSTEGISEEDIYNTAEKLTGEILQIPPMYSAVKINGKALYKYARKGKEIKREPRKIIISEFKIEKIEMPDIHFRITCSKGTYIRVIADDFGQILGCGGFLKELRRIQIGEFLVNDAFTIDEFREKFTAMEPVLIKEDF